LLGALSVGCGDPKLRIVARGEGTTVVDETPRDRVIFDGERITGDNGRVLRGVTLAFDSNPSFPLESQLFDDLRASGINYLHVFLENRQDAVGKNASAADILVRETRRAGLYLTLSIGALPEGGASGERRFDTLKTRAFWSFYAPRYKDHAHVQFEIHDTPELTCDGSWSAESLTFERDLYAFLRTLAPNTHLFLYSFSAVPTEALLQEAIANFSGVTDFSNESIAMHADSRCLPLADFTSLIVAGREARVPLMMTALPVDGWEPYTLVLEERDVSWTSLRWLAYTTDLAAFRQQHDAAGIIWCPDFGTWPLDSSTCTAP
jgi:hypothetical protein